MIKKRFRNKLFLLLGIVMMVASVMTACSPKEAAEEKEKDELQIKMDDINQINEIMIFSEMLGADPAIPWETEQVLYMKFTSDGTTYKCDCAEVIDKIKESNPEEVCVSEWADGVEIWAEKGSTGIISFSTSWDIEEMEEVSTAFAKRFSETSVKK